MALFIVAPSACDRDVLVGAVSADLNPGQSPVQVQGGTAGAGGGPVNCVPGMGGGGSGGTGGSAVVTPSCPTIATASGTLNACGRTFEIAYSPDGQLLATATQGPPANVHMWRLSDGALVREFAGHGSGGALSVAFSPDGTILATAGYEEDPCGVPYSTVEDPTVVKLWEVSTGNFLRTLPATVGFYASSAGFSHDGTRVVTTGYLGPIQVWRVSDGVPLTSIPTTGSFYKARFSPNDARIVAASYVTGGIWNASDGSLVKPIAGLGEDMNDAAFSPDGSQIATTGASGNLQVFDAGGNLLQSFHAHDVNYTSRVVWVGNDRLISDDWGGNVKSWTRDASGKFAASGVWSFGSQALGMAVSPDGSRLAVAGDGGFMFLSL